MTMQEITIVPTLRTVSRQVLASYHMARGMVQNILSLSSSGKLHWQFPDSSIEDRFLSVLKNNVSDTQGTKLLLQEIPQGFLQVPQNYRTHFPQPLQQCGVFLRLKQYKKLNEDYAST